jgi:hypothetical protein
LHAVNSIQPFCDVYLMLLVFAVISLVITALFAHLRGWTRLVSVYPATREEGGEKFRYVTGGVRSRSFPVRTLASQHA